MAKAKSSKPAKKSKTAAKKPAKTAAKKAKKTLASSKKAAAPTRAKPAKTRKPLSGSSAKKASKTLVVKASRIMKANGQQGAVVRAIQAASSQDLCQAARAAEKLTAQSYAEKAAPKRRGKAAPASVYSQSLSTLNRASGAMPVSVGRLLPENVCREVACEQLSSASGYCRVHYIKNWSQIKRKEVILKEKKLDRFIEEIVAKCPDRHIEAIKLDLLNDRSFAKVVADLELEGTAVEDVEGAAVEADAETETEAVIDTFRRDFESGETEGY